MAGNDINLYSVPSDAASPDVRLRAQTAASINGNLNVTEVADAVTASATHPVIGTATISEAAQTLTSAVGVRVTGSSTITEAAQTATTAAGVLVQASLSATEAAQTVTASGTITSGAATITGSLNVTEAADTVTASGSVTDTVASSGLRPGGIGHHGQRRRHLTIFPATPEEEEPPVAVEPLPRKPKAKVRKAAVAEIRKFAVGFIEAQPEPNAAEIIARLEATARYEQFMSERANRARVLALIARLIEEAANDDEEAAMLLLAA